MKELVGLRYRSCDNTREYERCMNDIDKCSIGQIDGSDIRASVFFSGRTPRQI